MGNPPLVKEGRQACRRKNSEPFLPCKQRRISMTKASVKGKYEAGVQAASVTATVNAGDLKLKATCTDSTFAHGPSLNGITLGIEKPGFFMIDYDLPKKAPRFQFMSSAKLAGKQLKLTYIHAQKANMTVRATHGTSHCRRPPEKILLRL